MHEDELMVDGNVEEYEALLPDGWSEGDDFFADPSTWTGNAKQTDEPVEQQEPDESTDADTGVEEAPTTGDTEDPDNRSAESEAEQTESGQTQEPVKNSRILKLKVNHTEQEIDKQLLLWRRRKCRSRMVHNTQDSSWCRSKPHGILHH